jgi:hypothetical protein
MRQIQASGGVSSVLIALLTCAQISPVLDVELIVA